MTDINRLPTSNVLVTGWTNQAGAAASYTQVDEAIGSPNDDTDYIQGGAQTEVNAVFGYSAFNVPAGSTDISLTLHARMKEEAGGYTVTGKGTVKVSNTLYNSSGSSLTTGWGDYSFAFANNPVTNATWTVSEINGVQGFGVYGACGMNIRAQCTQVYATVTYTPPALKIFSSPGGAIYVAGAGAMQM